MFMTKALRMICFLGEPSVVEGLISAIVACLLYADSIDFVKERRLTCLGGGEVSYIF